MTIESDSKEPTITYGYGRQRLMVHPSLNDLNLFINPFNAMTPIFPAPINVAQLRHTGIVASQIKECKLNLTCKSTPIFWSARSVPVRYNQTSGHSILLIPDQFLLFRAHPPRRRTGEDKNKKSMRKSYNKKKVSHNNCWACGGPLPIKQTSQDPE